MIIDAQNRPTTVSQTISGAAATTVSTDSIDLLTANRNVGRGFAMRAQVLMSVALVGPDSIRADLITSASSNLASPTVIATGATTTTANATIGRELLDVAIPGTAQRYLGFQFTTIGAGSASAGAVTGHVVAETDNQPYVAMNTGL